MLLSVISRTHRGRGLASESVSLLGQWRPEIRVTPSRAAAIAQTSRGDRPGPPGREVHEGPEVPEGGRSAPCPPGVRRLGRNGVLIVPFTHPDEWMAELVAE